MSCLAVHRDGERRADLAHSCVSEPSESLDEHRERDIFD